MHVSLTPELESMVKERVKSGMYSSASEVVREALRKFFLADGQLSREQAEQIRDVVAPRLQSLHEGTAPLQDFDAAFDEIEQTVLK